MDERHAETRGGLHHRGRPSRDRARQLRDVRVATRGNASGVRVADSKRVCELRRGRRQSRWPCTDERAAALAGNQEQRWIRRQESGEHHLGEPCRRHARADHTRMVGRRRRRPAVESLADGGRHVPQDAGPALVAADRRPRRAVRPGRYAERDTAGARIVQRAAVRAQGGIGASRRRAGIGESDGIPPALRRVRARRGQTDVQSLDGARRAVDQRVGRVFR